MNAIDTTNYHIEGNKGNVKLVSSLIVDSALLTALIFYAVPSPKLCGIASLASCTMLLGPIHT